MGGPCRLSLVSFSLAICPSSFIQFCANSFTFNFPFLPFFSSFFAFSSLFLFPFSSPFLLLPMPFPLHLLLPLLFLLLLPAPCLALPPDDFQLLLTLFFVLLGCALVLSVAFAAALFFFWREKDQNGQNAEEWRRRTVGMRGQWKGAGGPKGPVQGQFQVPPKGWTMSPVGTGHAQQGPQQRPLRHRFSTLLASIGHSFRSATVKIANSLRSLLKRPTSSVTHFPTENSQSPSYVSAQSPGEFSPQWIPRREEGHYAQVEEGRREREEEKRPKSILKKPKEQREREGEGAARRWEWSSKMGGKVAEMERTTRERVVEDRVEREERRGQGMLVAVERLSRTTTTTIPIGGGGGPTRI